MWAALNVESAAQLSVGGVVRCQGLKVEGGGWEVIGRVYGSWEFGGMAAAGT